MRLRKSMRQTLVMGNWKMNGSRPSIHLLIDELLRTLPSLSPHTECALFPPAPYLSLVQTLLQDSELSMGAQNVYPADSGAYTGEISGPMLREVGCRYVLVGHSERRHVFHEDEKFIAEKFHHVKDHDMIPVLCVGETLEERERGLTEEVLARQLLAVTHAGSHFFQKCIVAYEPVWAIGTGHTASPEQAQAAHGFIRNLVAKCDEKDALHLSILYGGSVTEKNARALFAMLDIDGGLVGGASLNAAQFVEIVKCIN